MKLFFDFLPLVLFFAAYYIWDIFIATMFAMGAGVLQIAYLFLARKKIDMMVWVSLFIIIVFGGATLYFKDAHFIKWKPTVLYWAFSIAIIVSNAMNKYPIKQVMKGEFSIPDPVWKKLGWMWAGFTFFLGSVNIAIAYSFSESIWVNYKVIGTTALMLLFIIYQSIYLKPFLSEQIQSDKIVNKDTHE